MAYSSIVKTLRDGQIAVADNAAANSITVAFEQGDLSIDIPGSEVLLFLDRNEITSPPALRKGKDQPMTGSFTAYLRDLDDATADILEQLVVAELPDSWVSTMGANGEVPTVTLTWTLEGTDHGDAEDHTLTLNYCYISGSIREGDPSVVTFNFTAYDVYPTVG